MNEMQPYELPNSRALVRSNGARRSEVADCSNAPDVSPACTQPRKNRVASASKRRRPLCLSLNILMIYDDGSTTVGTIYEHLSAFDKYSRHRYHFLSGT